MFLRKNGSLDTFYIFLAVDWSVTGLWLMGLHMDKTLRLDSVGEGARKCDRENQE